MRKQITSLLLTLAMLLSLVPTLGVTASAGEMLPFYEVGTYQELRSAVLSGKTRIKLKNDINTRDVYAPGVGIPEDEMITIGYDADITLDLNGCTLALETLVRGGFSFLRSTESWKSKIPALVKPEKSPGNSHPLWPQCSVRARAAAG